MKQKILIYSYSHKRIDEFLNLANLIQKDYEVIFVLNDKKSIDLVKKHGYKIIFLLHKKPFFLRMIRIPFLGNILNKIKKFSLGQILNEYIYYRIYAFYESLGKEIIREEKFKLFITAFDISLNFVEMGFLSASKSLRVPIFLPSVFNYDPDLNYSVIKDNDNYKLHAKSSSYQREVFRRFEKQTYKKMYFYQAFLYKIYEKLEILPFNPWINGSGVSNLVVVPNQLSFNRYKSFGVDENKISILGDISFIKLYKTFLNRQEIRNLLIKKYKLKNKKLLILGLANWYEHKMATKKEHLEVIDYSIKEVKKLEQDYSILISIHPSMERKNYNFIQDKYKVQILDERLKDVLPCVDLYVADQSSTIHWSVLCGIKTLVIACYKNLELFKYLKSVEYVYNKSDIYNELMNIVSKKVDFQEDWDLLSKDIVFDININDRYLEVIRGLIIK